MHGAVKRGSARDYERGLHGRTLPLPVVRGERGVVGADDSHHESADGDETDGAGPQLVDEAHESRALRGDLAKRAVSLSCAAAGLAGLTGLRGPVQGVAGEP